ADGDDGLRSAPLESGRVAEVGRETLIRLLADRARVEHDHVGLVLRRRLAQPELLEQALDPLRVVSVHLATERCDEVAAHRGQCTDALSARTRRRATRGSLSP